MGAAYVAVIRTANRKRLWRNQEPAFCDELQTWEAHLLLRGERFQVVPEQSSFFAVAAEIGLICAFRCILCCFTRFDHAATSAASI